MPHSEQTTAALTANEPANGTVLVVEKGATWHAIVRDDESAKEWDAATGDHWFNAADSDEDPMSLHQHIKYADAVYALGEKLATFR